MSGLKNFRSIGSKIKPLISAYYYSNQTVGVLLIFCTILSIFFANATSGTGYTGFWETELGSHTLTDWINDGLMAIFFLLVGLELKRELKIGELSNLSQALLPVIAALGGMIIPAVIYWFFNHGTEYTNGVGIPMATDIAFALGALSLVKRRLPSAIKIFLLALAIIDDLGAILVIAFFYSKGIEWTYIGLSGISIIILLAFNRGGFKHPLFYIIPGLALWYFMLHSGVHATLAGVITAFCMPVESDSESLLTRFSRSLEKPVNFIILPIFALANTCIPLATNWADDLFSTLSMGIIVGLVFGKTLGIFGFAYAAVKFKLCNLPKGLTFKYIFGAGLLGGIGFTMSIFIAILAFNDAHVINMAKVAVMVGSLFSGMAGFLILSSKKLTR